MSTIHMHMIKVKKNSNLDFKYLYWPSYQSNELPKNNKYDGKKATQTKK